MFTVSNGVRQGGILSPLFFNVYMDGLSDILCKTECGCTMGGRMINHLMYADDVVILSPSSPGNLATFFTKLGTNCNRIFFTTVSFYEVPRTSY